MLLLHKLEHITSSGLGLRQLCDWAVFVHRDMTPERWEDLLPKLSRFGLLHFARVITRICVEDLA
ncbi:nucleotidyltransferase family protein, partial [Anaerostipes caccae]|nr:nucleotidyltransferase family protein [Anaerostipes caccae]